MRRETLASFEAEAIDDSSWEGREVQYYPE